MSVACFLKNSCTTGAGKKNLQHLHWPGLEQGIFRLLEYFYWQKINKEYD
jgi:hypothetical protein